MTTATARPEARTEYAIRDVAGTVRAVHVRWDTPDGKRMAWQTPDGAVGLGGVPVADLPLFGSELVPAIPITMSIVITEGEKAALALRSGGIPALATVTGAASCPSPAALRPVALGAKFILWPDNDEVGLRHMQQLAENLYLAGAVDVRVIRYEPTDPGARWPKGYDAADVVSPETAATVLERLCEGWTVRARRPSASRAQAASTPRADGGGHQQRDTGSVTAALADVFGITAQPGRSTRCPMHDDRHASLSVLRDDLRAICHGGCDWTTPGVTASDIRAVKDAPR